MSNLKNLSNVCIISKTLIKNRLSQDYTQTHNILCNVSKIYPGCISSINSFKNGYFTNISIWTSHHMWKHWHNSSDRYYIKNDFTNNVLNENIEIFDYK